MSNSRILFSAPDGAEIEADHYPGGNHAVVLAHGRVFDKESWQEFAEILCASGLTVLALNFRGYGRSSGPGGAESYLTDLAGAVDYLKHHGAIRVSMIGGSMGAIAIAEAIIAGVISGIDVVALLSPGSISNPSKLMANRVLMVASADESLAANIRAWHAEIPGGKALMIYDGMAHAQHIFNGPHGPDLLKLLKELWN